MTKRKGSTLVGAGLVTALCLGLGACNSAQGISDTSLEASVPAAPGSQMQALAQSSTSPTTAPVGAVASMPEDAGEVASVRGHSYVDGFRQDIILKGGAVRGVENGITVLARTSSQQTLDERVPLFKPTEAAIRSEIGRAFPHVAMQVSDRSSSNSYGSYGLALGRSGEKLRCVYMWQWIDAGSLPRDLPGPVSLRVRLCKADTTFDALASLLDHLTIQRDAGAGTLSSAVVDPPAEQAEPHQHIKRRPRTHRVAATRREDTTTMAYAPAAGTPATSEIMTYPSTMTYPPPVAAPRSSVDLPPQAFSGPGARPFRQD